MIPAGYVSAAPLIRVLSYADQVGVDTGSLRKRMRLQLDMPVLLDSTVPLITAMNALHELEGLKNWNHFPILLGRIVASELSPLHAQLAKSTKTVDEWLEVLPPTESLIGDIGNLHMRSANDCCELIWELSLPRHPAASLVTDAMLVATARNLDLVTIEPSPPIKVLLPRKAHPGDAALKKELGGDIVYGAQVAGLVYPLDFFARAVQQISGLLPAIGAFQSGDTSPAEMRISPFIARLSNTILTHLHRNGAPIETVASALFMSVRTLQRRLKEHGLSYQQVRTELRQSRSKKLLLNSELSVEQVAEKLGYEHANAFGAAFRTWWGVSPSRYRRQHRINIGL